MHQNGVMVRVLLKMLEHMPLPVFCVDDNGQVFYVNRSYCGFLGLSASLLEGSSWRDLYPESEHYKINGLFEANGGEVDVCMHHPMSGKIMRQKLHLFDSHIDSIRYYFFMSTPVDEARDEQTSFMLYEVQNKVFFREVWHDFCNILNIMHQRLSNLSDAAITDEIGEKVGQLVSISGRMVEMARNFLSYASYKHKHGGESSLKDWADRMCKFVACLSGGNGIDVLVSQELPRRAFVSVPLLSLQQVFFSLCLNSRAALLAKGKVKIFSDVYADASHENDEKTHKGHIKVSFGLFRSKEVCEESILVEKSTSGETSLFVGSKRADTGYFGVSVEDNADGIPWAVLSRLSVSNGAAKLTDGTGNGLLLLADLVHNYGGYMKIVSREGKGTLVNIAFPAMIGDDNRKLVKVSSIVKQKKVKQKIQEKICMKQRIAHAKQNALVIEDQDVLAEMISDRLSSLGFQTFIASDMERVKHIVNKQKVDLCFADYHLGQQTIDVKRLRELGVKDIIFCTADVHKIYQEYPGAVCLSKPFLQEDIDIALASFYSSQGSGEA